MTLDIYLDLPLSVCSILKTFLYFNQLNAYVTYYKTVNVNNACCNKNIQKLEPLLQEGEPMVVQTMSQVVRPNQVCF